MLRSICAIFVLVSLLKDETQLSVSAVEKSELYPYGLSAGDTKLEATKLGNENEDISSNEIKLKTNIKFYSNEYGAIYVNENGLVSFLTEIPGFFNVEFPLAYPLIAALYSDVDTRGNNVGDNGGSVWYRSISQEDSFGDSDIDTNSAILARSAIEVETNFDVTNFRPTELFIATWDEVGYFDRKKDKRNTFQIIISSDDSASYVTLLYPRDQIKWMKGNGKNRNMPDAIAQAGIVSGDGRHLNILGSGQDQIRNLGRWSNVGNEGTWMYKLGPLDQLEMIQNVPPKVLERPSLTELYHPKSATSCANLGETLCHSSATCRDESNAGSQEDFCCTCDNGWFGDGKNCLPDGIPQRVNGVVGGTINSVNVVEQSLHCYVVTADGRTYTAISRIDPEVGFDMQSLTAIGNPVAWLYAKPQNGGVNGFSLTGGVFNYTADIRFTGTGNRATLKFVFDGLDAFGYLRATLSVEGIIPPLVQEGGGGRVNRNKKRASRVQVEDYEEKFVETNSDQMVKGYMGKMEKSRTIRSESTRFITLEETSQSPGSSGWKRNFTFDITQTIEFVGGGCDSGQSGGMQGTMNFRSSRNYIVYDKGEQVVRFAMTSEMEPLKMEDDPCRQSNAPACQANSFCMNVNSEAKCVCKDGYEEDPYNPNSCKDINECLSFASHQCDYKMKNSECVNMDGSYQCACKANYVQQDSQCIMDRTCTDVVCNVENSECFIPSNPDSPPTCRCVDGYEGNPNVGSCTVIPSKLKLLGYSEPEFVTIDDNDENVNVNYLEDLGPNFKHTYEVINLGHQTVHNAQVQIEVPYKSLGQTIAYLPQPPAIRYYSKPALTSNSPTSVDQCKLIDSTTGGESADTIINPLGLTTKGSVSNPRTRRNLRKIRKRRQIPEYAENAGERYTGNDYDYEYDPNLRLTTPSGADEPALKEGSKGLSSALSEMTGEETMPMTDEERAYLEEHYSQDLDDYDYDKNPVKLPEEAILDDNDDQFDEALDQELAHFSCIFNLAPLESAKISLSVYLNVSNSKRNVLSLANFVQYTSNAHLLKDNETKLVGSGKLSVNTVAIPRTPHIGDEPGKGMKCGKITCNRYADCHAKISSTANKTSLSCRCLPGFKGDGLSSCIPIDHEDGSDCRQEQGYDDMKGLVGTSWFGEDMCHEYSNCEYEDKSEMFKCKCKEGYQGDGHNCQIQKETCDPAAYDCTENAECIEDPFVEGYSCHCKEGYIGDGYICTRPRGDNGGAITESPDTNGSNGSNGNEDTDDGGMYPPNRVPQPTCVFSVCSCPPGWALNSDNSNNQICIEAPQPQESNKLLSVPQCLGSKCVCPYGYKILANRKMCGLTHIPFPATEVFCDHSGIQCGTHATCVYNDTLDHSICVCIRGYVGDGFECEQLQASLWRGECYKHKDCPWNHNCVLAPIPILQPNSGSIFTFSCIARDQHEARIDLDGKDLCSSGHDCHSDAQCVFDSNEMRQRCICDQGLEGDGMTQCRPSQETDCNACISEFDDDGGCTCLENPSCDPTGLIPEGCYQCGDKAMEFCRSGLLESGCDVKRDCDQNAKCESTWVGNQQKYVCQCLSGYSGDGHTCTKLETEMNTVIGCNLIDNCHEHASCKYNHTEGGFRCHCNFERGFEGDGIECRPAVPCSDNPNVCDENAECLRIERPISRQPSRARQQEEYGCKCKSGYLGDGYSCDEIPQFKDSYLIASQGMALMKVPFNATRYNPGVPIYMQASMTATSLDIDCVQGKLYWTDTTGKSIMKSNLDGRNVEKFIDGISSSSDLNRMEFPEGIAIDWVARNIYWTDSGKKTIEVARLHDGRTRSKSIPRVILFDEQIQNPRGIAVHPSASRLFWSDWDRLYPRIEASNLDGSDRAVLVDSHIIMPNSLVVDVVANELCWADGGGGRSRLHRMTNQWTGLGKIECMGIYGGGRRIITELGANEMPYGLALRHSNVYWTDWKNKGIHGVTRDMGERINTLPHMLSDMDKPYGLVALPNGCAEVESACQNGRGFRGNDCQPDQMCLPDGMGSYLCLCGDDDRDCNV